MQKRINVVQSCYLVFVFSVAFTSTASAYIGPGLGAGAVGVVLGIFGSIFLALAGIIWYPIKRALKRLGWIETAAKPKERDARRKKTDEPER